MATSIYRTCVMSVTSNGDPLPDVFSASGEAGFQLRTSQAAVTMAALPSWIDFWSPIQVDLGTEGNTVATRFAGYVTDFDFSAYPRAVTLQCRGRLTKAEQVIAQLDTEPTSGDEVQGILLAGMTDTAQVRYVLDASGMGPDYSAGDIGGMPYVLGTETSQSSKGAKSVFLWGYKQTGLRYIESLDAASLGFRTYQLMGGQVVRRQVTGRPSTGAAGTLFTEGVDLWRGTANHSVRETYNRVVVSGFDSGSGPVRWTATAGHPHPPPNVQYVSYPFSSPMIERQRASDPGDGIPADAKADQLIRDLNHVFLSVDLATPRDDFVNPGDDIGVYAPDRLQVAQNFWVQHVRCRVDEEGFTQELKVRAPAAVGRGGQNFSVHFGASFALGGR